MVVADNLAPFFLNQGICSLFVEPQRLVICVFKHKDIGWKNLVTFDMSTVYSHPVFLTDDFSSISSLWLHEQNFTKFVSGGSKICDAWSWSLVWYIAWVCYMRIL